MPPPGDSVYSRTPGDSIYSRTNSVDRHMLGRSLPGSIPSPTPRPALPGTSSPTGPTPTGGAVSPTGRLSMSGASAGLGALVSPTKPSAAGAIQATKFVGVLSPTSGGRTRSVSASVQGSTSTLLMDRGESVESDWEGNQVNAFTLAMDSLSPTPRGMSPVERGGDAGAGSSNNKRRLSRASPSSPSVTTSTPRTNPAATSTTASPDTTPTATAPSRTLPLPLPLPLPSPPADLPDITTAPLRGNDSIDRILAARRAAAFSPRPADPTASPILRAVPRPATPTVSAPATPRLVPLPGDPPRRTPVRTTKLDRAVQALLVWTAAVWPVTVPVAGMYWRAYVALRAVGRGAQAAAVVAMVLGFPAAVMMVAILMWAMKWMPRVVRDRVEGVEKWARRAAGGVGVAPTPVVEKVRGKKAGKRRDSVGKTTALDGLVGKDRVGIAPRAAAPS
ncbi:hypothetical protein AMAG_02553 [Allomyces macrogynus ATCC 38327]|uniref:Uncharacterized protein n=1 Tax=Allomyces macrogynus (strain ATCC 38327) TaxID=578462 RepID=A0A0L0S326_ALLM3|nr:hypothetical protein AMAG_02553 [Allomyces macrogynus ATCC 38327]|eukprot:KNE56779.1 hypothetical protein AMAG_02553 [Allomyces macrogynus ATCC 38327]